MKIMLSIKASLIYVFMCAMWLCAPPSNASQTLNFNQVNFYQDGSLAVPNSEWGEFNISYDQSNSLQWINVIANPGTANASWIVQNHPLLPTNLTGTSLFSSTSYFDLGNTRGNPVSSINIGYSLTSTPATATPAIVDVTGSFAVGSSQNIINSGVPSGVLSLGAPDNGNLNWNVPFVDLSTNWHAGMPNVTQELNWCGPGAATNSLHWLNGQHDLGLTQTLIQTQTELAANMMNNHDGNWDDKEVQGKLEFISDHDLPLEVHYVGGVMLPKKGNYTDPNGNGFARNDGAVTWDWIKQEMAKGQDIELMTNTHWVVLEGLLSWDNIHLLSYRDDPFQHGTATTAAEQETINNRHVWTYFSDGFTNIGNGKEVLQAAVAESIPEPSTFGLLCIGFIGLFVTKNATKHGGRSNIPTLA